MAAIDTRALQQDYKKPLEESTPPILGAAKIATLFHRVQEILQCHTLFRLALSECVRSWDREEKIGDVFVASFSKAVVLDIYSDFINNFSLALDVAKQESKRKSALADFLKVRPPLPKTPIRHNWAEWPCANQLLFLPGNVYRRFYKTETDSIFACLFVFSFSRGFFCSVLSDECKFATMTQKITDSPQVKQISSHDRLSFFGLMVKPVQRFPQFILLLQVK